LNPRETARKIAASLSKPTAYAITEAVFLRLLGLVYLAAFGSWWTQIVGLLGTHGIVPIAESLPHVRLALGSKAFLYLPTVFWLNWSNAALLWVCALGCLFALSLLAGFFSRFAAAACWVLYLSIVSVGQPFSGFQWDALLLESGFLALFAGTPWLVWAFRLLLFRLTFESGIVKLASHDPNWANLHALRFHFLTQPLPSPLAYYAYRAPTWLLDFLTGLTLAIELVVPFFLFGPRRLRQAAVSLLISLQVCIIVTGNYAFFNLLAIALCFWGLDDQTFAPLARFLRLRQAHNRFIARVPFARAVPNVLLSMVIALSLLQLVQAVDPTFASTSRSPLTLLAPFEIVNGYGLFAVMTTTRPEIVLEGSEDLTHWREYSFPYKPGELHRDLPLVAPHQPRLDWQMWFAALGSYNESTWVSGLMYRLLLGEPSVLHLLNPPPFQKPPHYMRALLYDYRFTTPAERERTGAIWQRQLQSTWFGPVSITGR